MSAYRTLFLFVSCVLVACGGDDDSGLDGGGVDAGALDGSPRDAPLSDAPGTDAPRDDGAITDGGPDARPTCSNPDCIFGCDEATPDTCYLCPPSSLTCSDDGTVSALVDCDASGMVAGVTPCWAGCAGTECLTLEPTNLPADICATPSGRDLSLGVGASLVIDTSDDAQCDMVVTQAGGPEICLKRYAMVFVGEGSVLRTAAGATRALAIVATNRMQLEGTIDASAVGASTGAGSVDDGEGTAASEVGDGGGGGGFATAGASGGGGGGVAGGDAHGAADLVPLVGGSSGGDGSPPGGTPSAALGGGGGGALQLVACGILDFRSTATLRSGGGGGEGGPAGAGAFEGAGGGGGGSGGAILVEAGTLMFQGTIVANGGGGGGGAQTGGSGGTDGADGRTSFGMGGAGEGMAGAGGAGGADALAPVNGSVATATTLWGDGGGGGAAGRIRLNLRPGAVITTGLISPSPSIGTYATR